MALTLPVEDETVLWQYEETLAPGRQMEPGETKEFPFSLHIPEGQSPSRAGEPFCRWAVKVRVALDAPSPGKPQPYEVVCSQIIEILE